MLQINTFHYSPEDVDCILCTKYGGKKRGCTVKACPWLAERIEAGVVGYEYLRDYPQLRRVDLCLDADGPGQAAASRLKRKYEAQGYSVAIHTPPRGKDWNEFLQFRQKCRGQER